MTIAEERIARLEAEAKAAAGRDDWDLSREYVRLARRIAERQRLRFPRRFDRFSCDGCDVFLRPGVNARVRLRGDHVVVTCCACGERMRYGYGEG